MCNMYVMHTRVQYASYYVSVYTLVGDALLLSKQSPVSELIFSMHNIHKCIIDNMDTVLQANFNTTRGVQKESVFLLQNIKRVYGSG